MLPIVGVVIFVIVVLGIFSMVSDALNSWTPSVDDYGITESTRRRIKLDSRLVTPSKEYITDSGELLYDGVNVRQSMVYFFEKTGVQPYIYITDTINGKENPNSLEIEDFAFETYAELFGEDEGHLLVVLVPFRDYEYDFYTYYLPGDDAWTVFDEEAAAIFLDCMDYYSGGTYDEMLIDTFRETADRIMSAPATVGDSGLSVKTFIWIAVAVVGVVAVVILVRRRKQQPEEPASEEETNPTEAE